MTGYVRTDTINNIADGNVISAADLDGEFNGVQAAFNSSTGHTHDGTSAEGAPITKLGPAQDVTISTTVLGVKTTNTVDLGTSSLKFKDFYLAGAASIGGTLGVTGATTLSAALTYGGVTLSNAVTGTGNMVLSASPTLTGTITAAAANFSGAVALNGNATIGDADTDTITQAASYVTGTQLKSAKTATNTLSLAAYDVDGTAYTDLITLTASNTPTLALTSTGVGTINNMSIGATTASTGAFTTLTSNGATTFTAGTASTTTGTGTLVITGGLGVSGRINAANFDGIVGANTAAAGSFTTLSATGAVSFASANPSLSLGNGNASAGSLRFNPWTATYYNWLIDNGVTTAGTLNITPSTAVGGNTYTTPVAAFSTTGLAVTGTMSSSGNATIGNAVAATNVQLGINGVVNKAQRIAFAESGVNKWLIGNGAASENGNFEIYDNTNGNNFIFTRTGNLGIGASPNYKLQVNGSADIINAQGTTANAFYRATSVSAVGDFSWGVDDSAGVGGGNSYIIYDRKNSAYRFIINNSGNAGLGVLTITASGSRRVLQLSNSSNGGMLMLNNSATEGDNPRIFGSVSSFYDLGLAAGSSTGFINFYTNGTDRGRFSAAGDLELYVTSGHDGQLRWTGGGGGALQGLIYCNGNPDVIVQSGGSGGVKLTSGATSWVSASDTRFKNIIEPIANAVDKVNTLSAVIYSFKDDETAERRVGLIAQELLAVLPEAVHVPKKEEEMMGVRYTETIPLLVAAIKEQSALITQLTARITALEGV